MARIDAVIDVQDLVLSLGDPLESDGADAGFLNASRSSESSVRLIHDIEKLADPLLAGSLPAKARHDRHIRARR